MLRLTFSCIVGFFFFLILHGLEQQHKQTINRVLLTLHYGSFSFQVTSSHYLFSLFCFCRCCLYHNCDLPVESVSNHCCKLSSTLHSQVLEAQIFSSKLLKAYLVKVIVSLCFFTCTSLQIAHSLCFNVYGFLLD